MILDNITYILGGVGVSLTFTLIAFTFGSILGLFIAIGLLGSNKTLIHLGKGYISVFRGTPLLVQLSIFYFVLPSLTGLDISGFTAGIIAFTFNCSAYVAEIMRGGIQSVDKGQYLASTTLGIPKFQMMKDIIIPQALRASFPALTNEVIALLKETALISTIGVSDIMKRANEVASAQYDYLKPLLIAAATYYLLVLLISVGAKFIERRFHYDCVQKCA